MAFCFVVVVAIVGGIVALVINNDRRNTEKEKQKQRWAALFHPERPNDSWIKRPAPGEIWQVWVPYHDRPGHGEYRPGLVIRTFWDSIEVLKSTGQDKSNDNRYIEITNTRSWDRKRHRNSYLYLGEVYHVNNDGLDRRRGRCDPSVWARVQTAHHPTGWYHGD